MKALYGYLNFDGNTREAMEFYARCLRAELSIRSFKDAGVPGPPGSEDRIIHARLSQGNAVLMASDSMPGAPFVQGNNVYISVDCESAEEIERLFKAFSEGARNIGMELQDAFWGARFGMLTDKFGMAWMFNYELPSSSTAPSA